MTNTNYENMQAENTPVSFNDHNGKLEVIPSKDDFIIMNHQQVAEMIKILSKWLADSANDEAG